MLPRLLSAKWFKIKGDSKFSQMLPLRLNLELNPGRSKVENTWNKYIYMYTYINVQMVIFLKKTLWHFFMSQFTAHTPTGKMNQEVKDTSKLLIRVLAYAQLFQETCLVKWVNSSTKAIINSSKNSFTWHRVCALTPLWGRWASSRARWLCSLLMLPDSWESTASCRSRFGARALVY